MVVTCIAYYHMHSFPDADPHLNSVDVTTPIKIFARGGDQFLSLAQTCENVKCAMLGVDQRPGWGEHVTLPFTLW